MQAKTGKPKNPATKKPTTTTSQPSAQGTRPAQPATARK